MGNSSDIKNNQEFEHGAVVCLKSGSDWMTVSPPPKGEDEAPQGFVWIVIWAEAIPPMPAHPRFHLVPTVCLVQTKSGDPSSTGD